MLAIRIVILVFVLFCWKTSKRFLLTFEREKKEPEAEFAGAAIKFTWTKEFAEATAIVIVIIGHRRFKN